MKILKQVEVGNVVVEFVHHAWGMYQTRVMSKDGKQLHSNFSHPDIDKAFARFESVVAYEKKMQRIA